MKTFGSYLQPYAKAPEVTDELSRQLERSSAKCTVSYGHHPLQGAIVLAERYTFPFLRDFLYKAQVTERLKEALNRQ